MSTASRSQRQTVSLIAALALSALGSTTVAAAVADHLLLSELVVQTRTSPSITGAKYVELVNPTASPIELSHVYLTNGTYNSPPTYYYDIVKLQQSGGGGTGGKFNARFPDGAVIAAGDTIAVSISGSTAYTAAYPGTTPDYELYEDGFAPDSVPDMVAAFPGSIGHGLADPGTNLPDLAASGQSLVLYAWDGQSDLVQDLDYVLWGAASLTSVRVDKTGVSVDGPDADTTPGAYLPDTAILAQRSINNSATPHNFGNSFQRRSADEGTETATGGNGLTGHDETSEQLNATWQFAVAATPPLSPVTVTAAAPVITAAAPDPASPQADEAVTVTANVLAFDSVTGVSLFWSDDAGATWHEVACTNTTGTTWTGQIPGRPLGTALRWYVRAAASGGGHATRPVDAPNYFESYTVVAAPVYPPLLLMTQVCTLPSPNEFVEIANPTGAAVDLSNYYLTDAMFSTSNENYWRIVEGNPSTATIGGGAFTDFHVRFPDGAHIAAGDTITVAIAGSDAFNTAYGFAPDFELFEDGSEPDDVPDMREVFPGSVRGPAGTPNVPSLSNAGEIVMLYYWDGLSDLVTDIDMFQWGAGGSYQFSKTGVCEDGPDADTATTCYKPDTATGAQQLFPTQLAVGDSYHRLDGNEGTERKTGGNGTLGHDETSENLTVTWGMAAASPSRVGGGVALPGAGLALEVPARTFLPTQGEAFPIKFRSLLGSQTELRIYDLTGRLVVTLYDSRFDGGFATAPGRWTTKRWNGRDRQFELMPAGMYVVHLISIDKRSGKEDSKTAPVVLATRLSK